MQIPLVASAAVQVDEPQRTQRVVVILDQPERVVLEPALPHLVVPAAALHVDRQVDAERRSGGIRRIARRHGQHVERVQVFGLLLDSRLELGHPRRESAAALNGGAELRKVRAVAVVEADVPAVTRDRSERGGVLEAEDQGTVATLHA